MKTKLSISIILAVLGATTYTSAQAYDGDWKRGRVYFRQVCTSCHVAKTTKAIPPTSRTKAEWTAYLQADKHDQGKESVKQYISQQYRASIKATNKAAEKFADVPDQELLEDTKAFLLKGAKDGDSPASCS
jgi:cytochrome c553